MNISTAFDNLFNGIFNVNLDQLGECDIIKNLPEAKPNEEHMAPPIRDLSSGGERLYRRVITRLDQGEKYVDIYVKGFFKPFKEENDFKITVVAWNSPEEVHKGRGHTIQEAFDKAVGKLFSEKLAN